jgi:hypothetical protein
VLCLEFGKMHDVHLGDLQSTAVVLGDLVEDRGDHLAGAAPFGPVVHQDGLVGLQDIAFERGVGHVLDQFAAHGIPGWDGRRAAKASRPRR